MQHAAHSTRVSTRRVVDEARSHEPRLATPQPRAPRRLATEAPDGSCSPGQGHGQGGASAQGEGESQGWYRARALLRPLTPTPTLTLTLTLTPTLTLTTAGARVCRQGLQLTGWACESREGGRVWRVGSLSLSPSIHPPTRGHAWWEGGGYGSALLSHVTTRTRPEPEARKASRTYAMAGGAWAWGGATWSAITSSMS